MKLNARSRQRGVAPKQRHGGCGNQTSMKLPWVMQYLNAGRRSLVECRDNLA